VCVCVCVCVCVSCVMREERWTGDEEGDEEVQAGEKGDEEIEHDNALKTLQFMKVSTMVHAHQYEVVDHVDAHDRLDRPHSSPSHRKPKAESRKPKVESRCCCCAAGTRTRVVHLEVLDANRLGIR
jgi:hypothetical protein